jgi:hypothetical protein
MVYCGRVSRSMTSLAISKTIEKLPPKHEDMSPVALL